MDSRFYRAHSTVPTVPVPYAPYRIHRTRTLKTKNAHCTVPIPYPYRTRTVPTVPYPPHGTHRYPPCPPFPNSKLMPRNAKQCIFTGQCCLCVRPQCPLSTAEGVFETKTRFFFPNKLSTSQISKSIGRATSNNFFLD